jgi:hypothetical protein
MPGPDVNESVDIVIRTLGARERLGLLARSITSVVEQRGVAARPVVVISGDHPDAAADLAYRHSATVHVVGHAISPGRAVRLGRSIVDAPFYAFLDDDDEFLPDAIACRLAPMRSDPAVDVVVTSGYWMSGEQRQIHVTDITRHQDDCLNGIIERCWLASCAALFRASSVPCHYFEDLPDLCEWTCLAFRLAVAAANVRFLDVPTYNCYDMPGSASKGDSFLQCTLRVLESMRVVPLASDQRRRLEHKYRSALHDIADHYRQKNELVPAWRYHLRSMKPPHALRYVAYTRKLLGNARASAAGRNEATRAGTSTAS